MNTDKEEGRKGMQKLLIPSYFGGLRAVVIAEH